MRRTLPLFVFASLTALAAGSANAYVLYSGIDGNGNPSRLTMTPNSAAAETNFRAQLAAGIGTENFENQTVGAGSGLALNFGAAGTATLTGGGGAVTATTSTPNGGTIGVGRYSVPGGTNYWDVTAGSANAFQISFSQEIAAFGFYGIDIGDFDGTVQIELVNSANVVITSLNVPSASRGLAEGSVLYFGVIASGSSELFQSIRFNTTSGGTGIRTDVFGFDSMTIATQAQVGPPPGTVPEPGTLALLGASLVGLSLAQRRRR